MKRTIVASLLILAAMAATASAHDHQRVLARHHQHRVSKPVGWLFGIPIYEAPHRRTRGSWSTRDADEQLIRSNDDAVQRAQSDAQQIQDRINQ